MRADVDFDRLLFYYSEDGQEWKSIGGEYDASLLSDECTGDRFTGAFIGLCCHDLSGRRKAADFDYFEYIERE